MVKVGVYLNQGDDGHDPLESEIVADKDCKDAEDRLANLVVFIFIIVIVVFIVIIVIIIIMIWIMMVSLSPHKESARRFP